MKISQFQVDAFAEQRFEGNPAAVCVLDHWLDDQLLQAIAEENNLSETAFVVADGDHFDLRWFTPRAEVNLCGHATLATAHVLFNHFQYPGEEIAFDTLSGQLRVRRTHDGLSMDFPALPATLCPPSDALHQVLGETPVATLRGECHVAVLAEEAIIRRFQPDLRQIAALGLNGLIITAPGTNEDFVSRYFAPQIGIPEDPVTGAAHCLLAPYWGKRLGKTELSARQLSRRGGRVDCRLDGDRVILSGKAITFMEGVINL